MSDRLAIEVDGNDCSRFVRDRIFEPCDVERVGDGVDINQYGIGAGRRNRESCGDERIGRGDDFIASTDTEGAQSQLQATCPNLRQRRARTRNTPQTPARSLRRRARG